MKYCEIFASVILLLATVMHAIITHLKIASYQKWRCSIMACLKYIRGMWVFTCAIALCFWSKNNSLYILDVMQKMHDGIEVQTNV